MPDPTPTPSGNVYADHARAYLDAGWRGVLPLPPRQKKPVPAGFTGRAGEWPGGPDIWTWMDDYPHGNIALRLPENVIGIDIDAYPGKPGALTYADAEHRWGKLPGTWRTTSRDDGVSGIRLFIIPEGLEWPNEVGPGIEVIRFAHRYAIVWPSIHPDTGHTYKWIADDGLAHIGSIPTIDELPALPAGWVQGLTQGRPDTREARTPLSTAAAQDALALFAEGEPCRDVARALAHRLADLQADGHGSRHEIMLQGTERLVRLGIDGHRGVPHALGRLRTAFLSAVSGERQPREAEAEWDRSLAGALANVHSVEDFDPCVDPFHGLIDRQAPATPPSAESPSESILSTAVAPSAPEPRDVLLAQEIERLRARRDAARMLADEEAGGHRALAFHTISDIRNRPKPEWIVEGLVQGAGVVLIAGEAGLGKSFACLDIAARVATGTDFFGRKVRAGKVAYVYAEGGEYLPERWDAWEEHNGLQIPEERLLIVEDGFNLSDPASVSTMADEVAARKLDLLILDTLSQLSSVDNENDAAQLAHVLAAARRIRSANAGMTVIIVHHVSKGEKARVRGSSVIKSNADAVIVAIADKAGDDKFILSTLPKHDGKQKNAKAEAFAGFYLETVGESAALARDTPEGVEMLAVDKVLADGDWHSPAEFYDEIGERSETLQKKLARKLNARVAAGLIEKFGTTKYTKYRLTPEALSDTPFGHVSGGGVHGA